ncbi:trypsin-like serine protease [Candidatus Burkholderia verschuerenii]|uniref:trypsin-like serine protease n=1 Tax=Candidatus Burkholderia verschuerenii TaxID=242163 RepID=UPI0018DB0D23|nr:trypsin-like serine protease [Candidatus Burkholderia verschuerenii]
MIDAALSPQGVYPPATCTAILIGPGVFLTAAHCFDDGPGSKLVTSAWLRAGGQSLKATCELSPEYVQAVDQHIWNGPSPRVSEDYAVCAFDMLKIVPQFMQDLDYENIDIENPLAQGSKVLMTGFGCSDRAILLSSGKNDVRLDGLLRLGDAAVTSLPSNQDVEIDRVIKINSSIKSAPALCDGHSGGPLMSGATVAKQGASRSVRGINSSVQVDQDDPSGPVAVSRIAPLATPQFKKFITQWLDARKHLVICGINATRGFLPCHD